MHKIIMGLIAACLAACGNGTGQTDQAGTQTKQAETAQNKIIASGKLNISLGGMETTSQSSGMFKSCTLSFTVDNRMGKPVKSLSVQYLPIAKSPEDNAVLRASGDKTLYVRLAEKGKTPKTSKVSGVSCEALSKLKIKQYSCALENDNCTANNVVFSETHLVDIEM